MRVATRRLAPGRPGREGHLGGQAATANGQRVMLLFEARMRKQGNSKAQVWRPTRSKLRGGMESGGLEPQGEKVAVRRSLGCKAGRQGTIGLRWESKGTARPHILITGSAAVLRAGWRRAREKGQFGLWFLQSRRDSTMRVEAVKNPSDSEVFECRGNRTHWRTKYGVERGSPRLGNSWQSGGRHSGDECVGNPTMGRACSV